MTRICPENSVLSEYLAGILPKDLKESVENHLSDCRKCRETVKDAYIVTSRKSFGAAFSDKAHSLKRHFWLLAAFFALSLSVYFSGYFIQFIALSLIFAMAWTAQRQGFKNIINLNHSRTNKPDHTEKRSNN